MTERTHVSVFELGHPGRRRRAFTHTECIHFPYKNYKGELVTRVDWDPHVRAIPREDCEHLSCVICGNRLDQPGQPVRSL